MKRICILVFLIAMFNSEALQVGVNSDGNILLPVKISRNCISASYGSNNNCIIMSNS